MNPFTMVLRSKVARIGLALVAIGIALLPLVSVALSSRDVVAAQETPVTDEPASGPRPRLGRLAERCQHRVAIGGAIRDRVDGALANLVADGVLTEDEAAAVRQELLGDAVAELDERAAAPGPCARLAHLGVLLQDVSTIVGLTPGELMARYAGGESLAEIAEREGVSREELIAALEAAIGERLDQAAANGRLSEEERAAIEAGLTEHLEVLVDRHRGDAGSDETDIATPVGARSA